ncbi:MAG: sortase [Abditibacteriaceae bacterium]
MQKLQRYIPFMLIALGIVLACWPLGQKAFGWVVQRQLQQQWAASEKSVVLPDSPTTPSANKSAWRLTRIVIPDLHIDAVVINGFDEAALRRGPAHDPQSASPGQVGNCVIAAHRNVYGSWFANIDQLQAESLVQLITPTATYNYHAVSISRISETDRSVLAAPTNNSSSLTLITCTLPHSTDRVVVTAVLGDAL